MCHLVVIKIARSRESLSTDSALVRLFAAVNPAMRVQARRRRKAFAANVAHVRSFAGVNSNVTLQKTRSVESLSAEVAGQHVLLATSHHCDARVGV